MDEWHGRVETEGYVIFQESYKGEGPEEEEEEEEAKNLSYILYKIHSKSVLQYKVKIKRKNQRSQK